MMMKYLKPALLSLLVLIVYVLHQDYWNWHRSDPLILGFLPVGLAYHAAYSFLGSLTMAILVKFAWPKHLENILPEQPRPADSENPHP